MTALWTPTPERIAQTGITDLMAHFNAKLGRSIHDYQSLHKLSIHEPESFLGRCLGACRSHRYSLPSDAHR